MYITAAAAVAAKDTSEFLLSITLLRWPAIQVQNLLQKLRDFLSAYNKELIYIVVVTCFLL